MTIFCPFFGLKWVVTLEKFESLQTAILIFDSEKKAHTLINCLLFIVLQKILYNLKWLLGENPTEKQVEDLQKAGEKVNNQVAHVANHNLWKERREKSKWFTSPKLDLIDWRQSEM